jgi:hypothetical protein
LPSGGCGNLAGDAFLRPLRGGPDFPADRQSIEARDNGAIPNCFGSTGASRDDCVQRRFQPRQETTMKFIAALLVLSAFFASAASIAATTPGHPSTDEAAKLLKSPKKIADADLPRKGKVLSIIDATQYSYIEVVEDKKTIWLAAPTVAVKKNNVIRYDDGSEMTNFHSKTLNRTFPSIFFVNRVVVSKEKE